MDFPIRRPRPFNDLPAPVPIPVWLWLSVERCAVQRRARRERHIHPTPIARGGIVRCNGRLDSTRFEDASADASWPSPVVP